MVAGYRERTANVARGLNAPVACSRTILCNFAGVVGAMSADSRESSKLPAGGNVGLRGLRARAVSSKLSCTALSPVNMLIDVFACGLRDGRSPQRVVTGKEQRPWQKFK